MYVDATSASHLELGTAAHPYKNLVDAYMDIYYGAEYAGQDVQILVLEGTANVVHFLTRPLIIMRTNTFVMQAYSKDAAKATPDKASISYTDKTTYARPVDTKYHLLGAKVTYDYDVIQGQVVEEEFSAITSLWNVAIVIKCNYHMRHFKIYCTRPRLTRSGPGGGARRPVVHLRGEPEHEHAQDPGRGELRHGDARLVQVHPQLPRRRHPHVARAGLRRTRLPHALRLHALRPRRRGRHRYARRLTLQSASAPSASACSSSSSA